MRFPSGDHATVLPAVGNGLFVSDISARKRAPVPSGCAIARPALSPTRPLYAIHWLSGDQFGFPDGSLSPPIREVLPSASVITQSWPYGRPAPSLFSTVYATLVASGETATPDTDRSFSRSLLCSRSCASATPV